MTPADRPRGENALDARRIAHGVLVRVEQGGAFANRALDTALSEAGVLDPRDAALATELVYGTLRRQIFIDHALSHFSRQPLLSLDAGVRALLRLGAHQLLHMRIPERAAVHATVELAKEVQRGRGVTYVNAVLRAVARDRSHILVPPASVDPGGFLSLSESFPRSLVEPLIEWKGFDRAAALLASLNHPAPLTIRVNSRKADRTAATQRLKAELGLDAMPTRFSPVGLTLAEAKTSVELLRPSDGAWQAQDEAAQLVSFFADPAPTARVLDACAGPGGKTSHLAEIMGDAGAIDAIDLHTARARAVEESARALGHASVKTHAADACLPLPFAPASGYDLVLVDAPCSGLGTVRRHPELKTRQAPEDIRRLAELQRKLLDNLARYVRLGGSLVYAVCTFTRDEGPAQIMSFLSRKPEFSRAPRPGGPVDWTELLDASGDLVTDPAHHGTDAFYAVRLVRRA
jgi:16S rRNA (cytosine967-C5)-methyltransferase